MDNNLELVNKKKISRAIEALGKNNMQAFSVENREELIAKIEELVRENSIVSCGGSMTLQETGVIEHLRSGRYDFLDRGREGITLDEIKKIYAEAFTADAYFTSSNAITENGELYNVDGNGNRVAAMIYGPEKVIVVASINKIVKDIDEAIKRVRDCAAPANAIRLNRKTPCTNTGYCMDCSSPERICRAYTIINRPKPNRIYVIFLNEELGY